jgi:hypothetical protein
MSTNAATTAVATGRPRVTDLKGLNCGHPRAVLRA